MKKQCKTYILKIFSSKYTPIFICTLAILIKLYLVSGQSLYIVSNGSFDDRLFILRAESLIRGNWLGEYNNLTLAKGIFYPLWIAGAFLAGIPLLLSEQILFSFSCVIFIIAIKPLVKNNIYLILSFIFILFHPISYSSPFFSVQREGIYVSLTLLLLASTLGLFLRRKDTTSKVLWIIISGLSLSTFYLTREEGIWILPFFIIIYACDLYEQFLFIKKHKRLHTKRILLLYSPFLIFSICLLFISAINYRYYKAFTTVEFKSKGFTSAYGALTRVRHNEWNPDVPVPKETRKKIYVASPRFQELEPFLEGDIGEAWRNNSGSEEIKGGWFIWAFRDAVASAGYYENGSTAEDYYNDLSKEVNTACNQKKLDCIEQKHKGLNPPFDKRYLEPLILTFNQSINKAITNPDFTITPPPSSGSTELMLIFIDLTRENVSPLRNSEVIQPHYQSILNTYKVNTLVTIYKIYQGVIPILIKISLIILVFPIFQSLRQKKVSEYLSILISLIAIFASRLLIISMIDISSFEAIHDPRYLSPIYIIISMFIILSISTILHFKLSISKDEKTR